MALIAKKKKKAKSTPEEDSGFFEPYAFYSKTLRAWLVAYGVGGPAIFITHPDIMQKLAQTGCAPLVGWLFLGGVAAQVLIAFLNKIAMWYIYRSEVHPKFDKTWTFKCADRFTEHFWVDIGLDVVSIFCFTVATVLVFQTAMHPIAQLTLQVHNCHN